MDNFFEPEESNFDRDNRFKRFKLGDFPSIASYLERYQDEMVKFTFPPAEDFKARWLNARFHLLRIIAWALLATAIQEIPSGFRSTAWSSSLICRKRTAKGNQSVLYIVPVYAKAP